MMPSRFGSSGRRMIESDVWKPVSISPVIGGTTGRAPAAAIRVMHDDAIGYTPVNGTLELREALSSHLQRRYDVSYDPATEMVITVGASEALAATLACAPAQEARGDV